MEKVDVAFAEEARQVCSKALIKLATGQQDAAAALLEAFGQRCVRIVQGAEMTAEVAEMHGDQFNLAALRVDLRSDSPEREEE